LPRVDSVNFRLSAPIVNLSLHSVPPSRHPRRTAGGSGQRWWQRLRRGLARDRRPLLVLQPIGVAQRDLQLLRGLFERLGDELQMRFDLNGGERDTVLLDIDYVGRTPATIVKALTGDRTVLLFERPDDSLPDRAGLLRSELLRQLSHLPPCREPVLRLLAAEQARPLPTPQPSRPHGGSTLDLAFDTDFDSMLQAEQLRAQAPDADTRALVAHVLRGLHDDSAEVLLAGYGPQAALRMDFAARLVSLDPQALQGLRVRRELPRLNEAVGLTDQAVVHDLDEIVWHLGMACGRYPLLQSPPDYWHARLVGTAAHQIERYSRQPRHQELMRRLQQGPASPSELRRHVRIQVADLLSFLQACLFLGLVQWEA